LYGALTIVREGNQLRARFGTGFAGPLEHWHYDTFRATWDARWRGAWRLTFRLDAQGKVASVDTELGAFARAE
jgi:hypothetical protein